MDSILRKYYIGIIFGLISTTGVAQNSGHIENEADTSDINICLCISGSEPEHSKLNFDYFSFYFQSDSIIKVETHWNTEALEQNRGYLDDVKFVFNNEMFSAEMIEENLFQDTLIKTVHLIPGVEISNAPIEFDFLILGEHTLNFNAKSQWSKHNRSLCLDYIIKFKED